MTIWCLAFTAATLMTTTAFAVPITERDDVVSLECDIARSYDFLKQGYTSKQTVVFYPGQKRVIWNGAIEYKDNAAETDPSLKGLWQFVIITPISVEWGHNYPDGRLSDETDINRRTGELSRANTPDNDNAKLSNFVATGQCHEVTQRAF